MRDAGLEAAPTVEAFGVTDLTVRFGATDALTDVTLRARPGEVTAIVGGDGAGKSTLLRVLANRVRAAKGDVRTLGPSGIGYQPATSGVWPTLTVAENVEFVGRSYGMPAARIRERSAELLDRAGLTAARHRLGHDLSGGMRQKLGFVLAILHEPTLVLLDEPSTGVDPVSRLELWRLISATAGERAVDHGGANADHAGGTHDGDGGGTTVIMATTYLDEAQRAASVLALDGGRMLAAGTPDEIVAAVPGTVARMLDPTATLSEAAAARSWRRGMERHVWIPSDAALQHRVAPLDPPDFEDALVALALAAAPRSTAEQAVPDPSAGQAVPRSPSERAGTVGRRAQGALSDRAAPTASASHVTKRFGHATALAEASLDVHPGEIVGLIGANGAGKTTLLRIMLGLERADEGEVTLFGRAPDNASRRRLGYVPQGLGLYTTLSVRENVAFLSRVYGVPRPELPPALSEVRSRIVADIGLGRQRQLAFALALSHGPELLVLDEPTSGVDPLARARLWDTIHAQADAGRAVIVTTHYLQEAEQCTSLVLLAQGHVVGRGTVAELTAGATAVLVRSEHWQRVFGVLDRSGLPIMLSGRDVRVAGREGASALRERVMRLLDGIQADVVPVPATLEETVVLLDSGSNEGNSNDVTERSSDGTASGGAASGAGS
ncbi:ATP-binding cassette domain-containing protein [Humibacter ginsenosidimutans]|uniref:ABC transporter ATP-binding protein n=1 Tax=Humibacter ginsenosidimutans TaxID=2599293 RepID=A0A5B8M9E1_9MICO|nr:ATP-binding cassette domain-containing protein [Humibacter ginsenosidimutans]QDZ16050.1 ABC transporter ATP-binding protein [Humibacter ginsenosidimutans]